MTQRLRGSTAATAVGALAVAAVLIVALAGHRDEFAEALRGGAAVGAARRDRSSRASRSSPAARPGTRA